MKKYTTPTIVIVELQSREDIAVNPLAAVTVAGSNTTTYNLALLGEGSQP